MFSLLSHDGKFSPVIWTRAQLSSSIRIIPWRVSRKAPCLHGVFSDEEQSGMAAWNETRRTGLDSGQEHACLAKVASSALLCLVGLVPTTPTTVDVLPFSACVPVLLSFSFTSEHPHLSPPTTTRFAGDFYLDSPCFAGPICLCMNLEYLPIISKQPKRRAASALARISSI